MNHSLSGFKQPVENDEADKNLSFKSVKFLALLYGKCDFRVFLFYLPHIFKVLGLNICLVLMIIIFLH